MILQSSPGCRPHQPFPLSQIATKPKLARRLPAHPSRPLAPLAALRVRDVPVIATGDKNVRGQRVVLGSHCFQDGFRLPERLAQVFQGVLEPTCLHPPR